jgi:hypothetical protein
MSNTPDADDATAKKRAEIKKIIDNVDWKCYEELIHNQGRQLMYKYKAALRFGFTETQALFLCCQEWK